MTKIIIVILILVVLLGGVLLLFSLSSQNIEKPEYKVLKNYDGVEIRKYPKMVVARTTLSDKSYKNSANQGFRTIAGYIFGAMRPIKKLR